MIKGAKNSQRGGILKRLCFNERGSRDRRILNLPVLIHHERSVIPKELLVMITCQCATKATENTYYPQKHPLTSDHKIDVLASGVAHVVDGSAVVEASVSRSDRSQEEHRPPDLSAQWKGARVAGPGHGRGREAGDDLTVEEHVLPRVHNHCVIHRQPDHRRSCGGRGEFNSPSVF